MAGRLDLRQYVPGNNSQCSGNIDKLNNVNSSLSVLIFGDKGLWFAQRLCHVGLRLGEIQIGDVVTKLRDAEEELMLVVSEEEAIGEVVSDLRGVIEVLQQIRLRISSL